MSVLSRMIPSLFPMGVRFLITVKSPVRILSRYNVVDTIGQGANSRKGGSATKWGRRGLARLHRDFMLRRLRAAGAQWVGAEDYYATADVLRPSSMRSSSGR